MPDAWTYISKPTNSVYTFINPTGKETYDESTLTYDDSNVFYDGVDMDAWTPVAKPLGETIYVGIASGLLIPLTFRSSTIGTAWTPVSKPNT